MAGKKKKQKNKGKQAVYKTKTSTVAESTLGSGSTASSVHESPRPRPPGSTTDVASSVRLSASMPASPAREENEQPTGKGKPWLDLGNLSEAQLAKVDEQYEEKTGMAFKDTDVTAEFKKEGRGHDVDLLCVVRFAIHHDDNLKTYFRYMQQMQSKSDPASMDDISDAPASAKDDQSLILALQKWAALLAAMEGAGWADIELADGSPSSV